MEKIENGQNMINTIETEMPRNLVKDFDEEIDDIFTKLGSLSPSNSSFDSPILNNRNKTYLNEINLDRPKHFRRNTTNKIINIKTNYKSILNTVNRTKKINNGNNYFLKTESRNYRKNKMIKNKRYNKNDIIKTYDKFKSTDDLFKNLNMNSKTKFNYNYNENITDNLPIINENAQNIKDKESEKIINEKIEYIISLIKEMKDVNKLKRKDLKKIINNLSINKNNINFFNDNLIQLLEYIINILNSIKYNKTKSDYKVGNEKIILKLKNEIKEKDKNIGEIINNCKREIEKLKDIIKTNNKDINYLKKDNKELLNKLNIYQKQISKIELDKEILEEKFNKTIIDKTTKTINSSTSVRINFNEKHQLDNSINIINNESNKDPFNMTQPISQRYIPPSEQNKNLNYIKLNEKYNLSKKLNMNLIDLLKEINNLLCFYDSFLNKENGINKNKNLGNNIKNLVNNMDINALIEENKTKKFHNEYMRNAEIVFNKMEEFIKGITNKGNKGINKNKNKNEDKEIIKSSKTIKLDKSLSMQKKLKTYEKFK